MEKNSDKIQWKNVSFKEHMEMNTHWEFEGLALEDEKWKRRFLMFCDKDIKVWLTDLKENERFEVPFGAQAKGKAIALNIIKNEEK